MEKFRSLKVWCKAHKLILDVCQLTKSFPEYEKFGLISQMRRAAISVVANIAEGSKRTTSKDRSYFVVLSGTSLEELKYYIILSYELNYIQKTRQRINGKI